MIIRRGEKRFFFPRVVALGGVVATNVTVVALLLLLPSLVPTTHTGVGVAAIVIVVTATGMTADCTTITLPI